MLGYASKYILSPLKSQAPGVLGYLFQYSIDISSIDKINITIISILLVDWLSSEEPRMNRTKFMKEWHTEGHFNIY